ncbi:uncharacterized protein YjfI (DUF2170 family) [Pseudomonas nitritireducens]|uniref:Uncharacterized protein YjfI (DUF2170 family) n=1 Tax=Pseudomonas nitroreducens TaxID=46680 RepID=A0A7W7KQV6_PSENT|nr:DUF2170 family protein [Pseudomonas nitritireducens]MBB4866818.1 uncharacterized protein YjfI (DUF2170 family) [Pseudomonas nitritireducens]
MSADKKSQKGSAKGSLTGRSANIPKKTSADYEKARKDRLHEAGLIRVEAWVLPENKSILKGIEQRLRRPVEAGTTPSELESLMTAPTAWSTESLAKALIGQIPGMTVTQVGGMNTSIHIVSHEHGDLEIFGACAGEQTLFETNLFPVTQVADSAAFNEGILRSRALFELSAVSIEQNEDEQDWYIMYGTLSSGSSLADIVKEVVTLAENTMKAMREFQPVLVSNTQTN